MKLIKIHSNKYKIPNLNNAKPQETTKTKNQNWIKLFMFYKFGSLDFFDFRFNWRLRFIIFCWY